MHPLSFRTLEEAKASQFDSMRSQLTTATEALDEMKREKRSLEEVSTVAYSPIPGVKYFGLEMHAGSLLLCSQ